MAVIRMVSHFKSAAVALLITLGIVTISNAAQTDNAPPKELVQYIRDAQRRGVTEAKIKTQAVDEGWTAQVVDEAIANEKSGKKSQSIDPSSTVVTSKTPPSVPTQLEPAAPAAPTVAGPAPAGTPADRGSSADYHIGAGDTLQISVWKEPDASVPSVVVRPDGKITVPLIKELEVEGLTPKQAEQRITDGLAKFITNADVTVVVAAINSKKIYLIGAVRKEGTLPYTYGMSIMQALSEAGGLTDYAKRKKIYVLRTENGREYRLDFNYDEVVRGERMDQNILLLSGDTVVIPH